MVVSQNRSSATIKADFCTSQCDFAECASLITGYCTYTAAWEMHMYPISCAHAGARINWPADEHTAEAYLGCDSSSNASTA